MTHLIAVWTLWSPRYWLAGNVKAVTALASVATALVLPPLVPRALALIQAAKLSDERQRGLGKAHAELEAAHARVKDLDRLKTQFFANVSHELRTPLALILGPVEQLLQAPDLAVRELEARIRVGRHTGRDRVRVVEFRRELVAEALDDAGLEAAHIGNRHGIRINVRRRHGLFLWIDSPNDEITIKDFSWFTRKTFAASIEDGLLLIAHQQSDVLILRLIVRGDRQGKVAVPVRAGKNHGLAPLIGGADRQTRQSETLGIDNASMNRQRLRIAGNHFGLSALAFHFHGRVERSDLPSLYAAADVFVFPSRTDTFGLVLLEALASGLPVAAYPVPGPLDIIDGTGVGVLDVDLAAAARQAITISPERCREIALQYSWRASAEQFVHNLQPFC
jgi:hypothetical protein